MRIAPTPFQGPNANAYAERFVRSVREECLDRLILFGERPLIRAVDEFVAHYHSERNHQAQRAEPPGGVRRSTCASSVSTSARSR